MKMNFKKKLGIALIGSSICFLSFGIASFSKNNNKITAQLQTTQTMFMAGDPIALEFELNEDVDVQLYCHASYGIAVISPYKKLKKLVFEIPKHIANKKGVIHYQLLCDTESIYKGEISIVANTKTKTQIESYLGPPSILAGGDDYTMLVVVPTDALDNPLNDSTEVKIKHQFLEIEKTDMVLSNHFIGWENLFSYEKSGRFLISSQVYEKQSKELTVEVFPAQATDFEITSHRKHKYADGNQITIFETSVIKDIHNNKISDGTIVDFVIKNKNGYLLKTQGSTIEGVAKAKILHPDHQEQWQIKAYITGMGISNVIELKYDSITADYPVIFEACNRDIIVGPIQSFMGQLIPNGGVVKLKLYKNNEHLETLVKTSLKGMVTFKLSSGFYEPGTYDIKIEAFGISKEFKDFEI